MRTKLISWNVNGLRAVEKKGFVDFLNTCGADILAIQETKALPEQLSDALRNPSGWHTYFCSAERKGYSGVAVYTRQKPLQVWRGLGEEEFDKEGRTLILEFPTFFFLNIYYPNGGQGPERIDFKLRFYDCFLRKSQELFKTGKSVIVCGDVNTAHQPIDLARPKENETHTGFLPQERVWLDKFIQAGYTDTFRHFVKDGGHYTWWDYKTGARKRNVGWRIDYFFIDTPSVPKLQKAGMLSDVMGSDHCPIELVADL